MSFKNFYDEKSKIKLYDREGLRLEIFNESLSGGTDIRYKSTHHKYPQKTVYLDGVECIVKERKMGGFSIYPASSGFTFSLNWKFILMMIFFGIFSFGMVPLIFWIIINKKYPKSINEKQLVMRNGEKFSWTDLDRVEQATMTMFGMRTGKGALELYFRNENHDKEKYVVIPIFFISRKNLLIAFLNHIFHTGDIEVREKFFRLL